MNIGKYCPSQYIILHSQVRAIWYTARDNIDQLWTFYEVNMFYMNLLGLFWPKTKSDVNIILTGPYITYWQSKKSLVFILHM